MFERFVILTNKLEDAFRNKDKQMAYVDKYDTTLTKQEKEEMFKLRDILRK